MNITIEQVRARLEAREKSARLNAAALKVRRDNESFSVETVIRIRENEARADAYRNALDEILSDEAKATLTLAEAKFEAAIHHAAHGLRCEAWDTRYGTSQRCEKRANFRGMWPGDTVYALACDEHMAQLFDAVALPSESRDEIRQCRSRHPRDSE
jgi:hypothetical protein